MTLEERNAAASAYLARNVRRRERNARRRLRRLARFFQLSTPFAAGICMIGAILVLA